MLPVCPCGENHQIGFDEAQAVAEFIDRLGPDIDVSVGGHTYQVPRIWIACHGLIGGEVAELAGRHGWPRTT